MKHSKEFLEQKIKEKHTLGKYLFDESLNQFTSDVEVRLYIAEVKKNLYQSKLYFFDGYEISLQNAEQEYYKGSEEKAKKMAIKSFHKEKKFQGCPVVFLNITCDLF